YTGDDEHSEDDSVGSDDEEADEERPRPINQHCDVEADGSESAGEHKEDEEEEDLPSSDFDFII
ncbi:hypothetical protein HDU89_008980, partial [Geranomyces variabilis]